MNLNVCHLEKRIAFYVLNIIDITKKVISILEAYIMSKYKEALELANEDLIKKNKTMNKPIEHKSNQLSISSNHSLNQVYYY